MGLEITESRYLHHLLFADDQMIVTQDGEDADCMCNQLAATYAKWSLKINFRKTEYLTNDPDELYSVYQKVRSILMVGFRTLFGTKIPNTLFPNSSPFPSYANITRICPHLISRPFCR